MLDVINVLLSPTSHSLCPTHAPFLRRGPHHTQLNSGTTGCVSLPLPPPWLVWPSQWRQQWSLNHEVFLPVGMWEFLNPLVIYLFGNNSVLESLSDKDFPWGCNPSACLAGEDYLPVLEPFPRCAQGLPLIWQNHGQKTPGGLKSPISGTAPLGS